jgi:type IV secretory pathway protease TraF
VIARASILATALGGVGMLALALRPDQTPLYIWNASASVPLGLYSLQTVDKR